MKLLPFCIPALALMTSPLFGQDHTHQPPPRPIVTRTVHGSAVEVDKHGLGATYEVSLVLKSGSETQSLRAVVTDSHFDLKDFDMGVGFQGHVLPAESGADATFRILFRVGTPDGPVLNDRRIGFSVSGSLLLKPGESIEAFRSGKWVGTIALRQVSAVAAP
ncbi:MAG: hypothetical protein RLZZ142_2545 [Verrucomicrobiota bacterium]